MIPDWLRRPAGQVPVLDIGGCTLPVTIRRLRQARRMTLRLAPDGSEVRLSIPQWARSTEALAFARSRTDWLAAQLAALPVRRALADGVHIPFRGAMLRIEHLPGTRRGPVATDGVIRLGGACESLALRLRRWMQAEARRLLSADLADYCAKAGLAMPPLALSNARRRWGSCSAGGTIRINWRLIMAPDPVRRSVVAHEVAHLLHFDHSPQFHAQLDTLFEGRIAEANRWLKHEGRGLYGWFDG